MVLKRSDPNRWADVARRLRAIAIGSAIAVAGCQRGDQPPPAPAPKAAATLKKTAADPPPPAGPTPRFVNVAAEAGVTRVLFCGGPRKDHILESTGCGCAWFDYDQDGLVDIFLANAWALDEEPSGVREKGHSALYRNLGGGRFADVTADAGLDDDDWGAGVAAGDYDNDGHVDLLVTHFGRNKLYRNRGNGTFEEVGQSAGLTDEGWWAGAAFFDADGDGDLDLYVANYIVCTLDEVLAADRPITWRNVVQVMEGPFGMRGGRDRFYRNDGHGHFVDATDEAGLTDLAESYGLGVLASDLDNDGDVDIYVANDSNPNYLYRNNGDGHFTEMGSWSGAGLSAEGKAQAGMGVDAGDFDGDGLLDIFVTNFGKDYSTLYKNNGKLFFADITRSQPAIKEATYDPVSWGCAWFDFDLDGDLDLVVINGHIYPQVDEAPELNETYRQLPVLLRNDNGKLVNVSREAGPGFQVPISGRGLALADFDDDGDLDLLVTAIESPPLLLRNDTPHGDNHWLKVRLVNRHGSPAINARATIAVGGQTQLREVRSGGSYQSQHAFDLHFGLGPHDRVESIRVRWPGGSETTLANVAADQTLTLREGEHEEHGSDAKSGQ